jgi:hypothetical protein
MKLSCLKKWMPDIRMASLAVLAIVSPVAVSIGSANSDVYMDWRRNTTR